MRRLSLRLVLALALASCLHLPTPALAQTSPFMAYVVPSCGAVSGLVLNEPHIGYMDQTGNFCTSGTGSGGAAASGISATGISTFSRITSSVASTNVTNAKSSPGRALTYQGCNATAATIYLRLYNTASVASTVPGTTAVLAGPYAFPANTCVQSTTFVANYGVQASVGLSYSFGMGPVDTDTTGIGAASIVGFQLGFQ